MVNKVTLIGHLGADPELRHTPGGKAVAELRIATTFGSDKATEWHSVIAWEKTAESAAQYLKKGSKVYVEGRIQTRTYDKDGEKRYRTEVIANEIKFLDSKRDEAKPADDLPF
jgi:single-strand DNA-binding protein